MTHEQLIQNYFKGALSESDFQSVETLLKTDSNFKSEFEDYENMQLAFKEQERQTLKARLQHLETQSSITSKKWYQQSWLRYAAIVVVFLGLGYSFFYDSSSNFYEDYYDVYPNVEQPIVRGAKQTTSYNAFLAYENQDYKTAEIAFKTLLENDTDLNLKFYYAMALLNQDKTQDALTVLKDLKQQQHKYLPETLWYTALIYCKNKNFGAARKDLQKLELLNPDFNSSKREKLLKALQKY